jgi:CHASE2 domain-containing sensor protein
MRRIRIKEALQRLRAWWGERWHTRRFFTSLTYGIVIGIVLEMPFVQRNPWIENARNSLITWQMKLFYGSDSGDNIAWIDIDENAYRAWHGTSNMTPRDKLLALIKYAVAGKPRVIVVDIALPNDGTGDRKQNDALASYLGTYGKTCVRPCPKIVLVRTLSPSPSGANVEDPSFVDSALGTAADAPWQTPPQAEPWRKTPPEPWDKADPVLWGTAQFDLEPDLSVRRWRLWEVTCAANGRAVLTPSAVFEAVSLEDGLAPSGIDDEMQRSVEPGACGATSGSQTQHAGSGGFGSDLPRVEALTEDKLLRRIVYRIPYRDPSIADAGEPNQHTLAQLVTAGGIPGSNLTPGNVLSGEIVVIGATFAEGGDAEHPTPVGTIMPGSFILINEMNSLLNDDYLKETPPPLALVVEFVLIVAISALSAAGAEFLGAAVVVLAAATAGLFAFRTGFWFDSVVPLIAVLIHEFYERYEHRVKEAFSSLRKAVKSLFPKTRS